MGPNIQDPPYLYILIGGVTLSVLLTAGGVIFAVCKKRNNQPHPETDTPDDTLSSAPLTSIEPAKSINSASAEDAASFAPYVSHITADNDSMSSVSNKKRSKNLSTTHSSRDKDIDNDKTPQHEPTNAQTLNGLEELKVPSSDIDLGDELGRGGFGVVYKGKWHGKTVAVKQLNASSFTGKAQREFLNEALTMAKLRFPNIVQLFGVCADKQPYALVMEYLEGGSLFQLLQSDDELPWELRLNIMLDVGRGLAYLHSKHIIHRDLKSPNVLLTEKQEAKLSDFGLSTVKSSTTQVTYHKGIVGSACWMAPELLKRGAKHNEPSDIYSYGMVMWEIASREIPYKDANGKMELVLKWVEQGETEKRPEDTPEVVWELIEDCWNKAPEQRPSAKAAVEKLSSSVPTLAETMKNFGTFAIRGNLTSGVVRQTSSSDQAEKGSHSAKSKSKHKSKKTTPANDSTAAEQETFSIKANLDSDVIQVKHGR